MLLDAIRIGDTEILVDEIKLSHAGVIPLHHHTIEYLNGEDEGLNGAEFFPAIRIAAYDDRSIAPVICTIRIRVYKGVGVIQFMGDFKAD
ncbi:hypothetical protein DEA98_14190 [Brucella pseudogrignonensis]|uniref:Uncharacterized protein n=1 Tax=Brucella pseudogrignonensis TaxID=419475 RepID=A0A7Y3T3T7_9HYPH|nr:hypothetical protein [Brucella pseudogrignonensis]MCM0752015.1 hypothetical protein [Brucella pseudogrignonensis]NNV20556.1 hypothetical protein [Brucella pseudogrignonensis]